MIGVAHVGAIASASQQRGAGGEPVDGPHRYWRVLFTATQNDYSRVNLSELEFWDRRYARRATGTYSESGAINGAGLAYDGLRQSGGDAGDYWISNTGDRWIKIDAGSPIDLAAVVIWRSELSVPSGVNGDHVSAFDVQYSDDGTSWTTLWSVSGSPLIPVATTPGLFENPFYGGDPAPALDTAITPRHWLRLDGNVYSDAGSTPAVNNDGIAQAENYGSEGTAFAQATGGIRPVFKTGGLNGKPFLRCAAASQQRFADIAVSQPSGAASLTPYCVAAVTDNINVTGFPALIGGVGTNAGKASLYFRSAVNNQLHVGRTEFRFGNVANPQVVVASRASQIDTLARLNNVRYAITSGSSEDANSQSSVNFLWADALDTNGYFDGDLYEFMYLDAAATRDLQIFRIQEYLNGKYGGIY